MFTDLHKPDPQNISNKYVCDMLSIKDIKQTSLLTTMGNKMILFSGKIQNSVKFFLVIGSQVGE